MVGVVAPDFSIRTLDTRPSSWRAKGKRTSCWILGHMVSTVVKPALSSCAWKPRGTSRQWGSVPGRSALVLQKKKSIVHRPDDSGAYKTSAESQTFFTSQGRHQNVCVGYHEFEV
jgi:hypothetical protein